MIRKLGCAFLLVLLAGASSAAEPVRRVDVMVTPYYTSADTADGQPLVQVARAYDELLASNEPVDIRKVAAGIEAEPDLITPMTLMVLAIRMYDVGLRDESVFWFYVAKDRYVTASRVIDFNSPLLSQAREATAAFATLAGPIINGYAFCNIQNQRAIRQRAVDWVQAHPYQAAFIEAFPALPGDRQENLAKANLDIRAAAAKEREYIDSKEYQDLYRRARVENEMEEKFCWK